MTDATSAEFDTLAEWTAQVALDLGPSFYVPAGCRGSGNPAALDWLITELDLDQGETLLDCGAGVGGPAAYAARERSVRPVLVEPEGGACRAAASLFEFPVLQAAAAALPLADESLDAAWSLGVLCTTRDQLNLLEDLRRVVCPPGRIGLLVFVARSTLRGDEQPEGNYFPTAASLQRLIDDAGLRIDNQLITADLPAIPAEWQASVKTVDDELRRRHGNDRAWHLSERQSDLMDRILRDGVISGVVLSLRHR